ncbi:MAG: HalOD1 output domain-containing protein [Halohasta sp.]
MSNAALRGEGELHYVTQYDPQGERPIVEVVIDALVAVSGRDPLDLPPLYEAVDPDALELIVREPNAAPERSCFVGFSVGGWGVIVTGSGEVQVYGR